MNVRSIFAVPVALAFVLADTSRLVAEDFWADTYFLNFQFGSSRSSTARALGDGSYELADGTAVRLADWYTPRYKEVTALFLTQVQSDLGFIWGIGSGERAPKYRIAPSLHLGFAYQREISAQGFLSVSIVVPFGGRLREKTCLADYGDIGGIQEVNCRLAASELPPEQTLDFLVDMPGYEDAKVNIGISWRF